MATQSNSELQKQPNLIKSLPQAPSKPCEFCGKDGAKNIYYQKLACNDCMKKLSPGKAKEIKDFPGQHVDAYLRKHGKLPEEN